MKKRSSKETIMCNTTLSKKRFLVSNNPITYTEPRADGICHVQISITKRSLSPVVSQNNQYSHKTTKTTEHYHTNTKRQVIITKVLKKGHAKQCPRGNG
jgi:hypothetical protein